MTIQHRNIPDADLHEPKGIAAATANKVYVSDGSGSGTWGALPGKLYSEIYIDTGVTAVTLAAASAYAKLNPSGEWTENISNGLVATPLEGEITLTTAGVYLIEFWIVFDTAAIAANSNYRFKFAFNGTPGPRVVETKKTTNGVDRLHLSAQGLVTASANDILTIHASGDGTSSGTAITVREAGLMAIKLAD